VNSRQTNNFFIHSSLSGISTAYLQQLNKNQYYQHLIHALLTRRASEFENVEQLTKRLAAIARQAYVAKQTEVVEQASQLMSALSIFEKSKSVAVYYEALCKKQRGDIEGARQYLKQVADGPLQQYRARALQNLGATYFEKGNATKALPFYLAAQKVSAGCDITTQVESQWMIAVVRSIYGDHKQSLNDLESLFPIIREIGKYYPAQYYNFLNSLAVELSEAGRIAEAKAAINIALASPYASVYPGWFETCDEIEQKRNYPDLSRCFIDCSITESEAVPDSTANLLVEADAEQATEAKPIRISTLCRFVGQSIYQRPVNLPNAVTATIPGGSAKSFLRYLGRCIRPRAPPML
jgi:tetratricopeptide (TPR) repeat protein